MPVVAVLTAIHGADADGATLRRRRVDRVGNLRLARILSSAPLSRADAAFGIGQGMGCSTQVACGLGRKAALGFAA